MTWAGRKREAVRAVVGSWGPEVNKERIQAQPFLEAHPSLRAAPVETDKPLSQLGICDSGLGHAPSGDIFKCFRVETKAENNPTERWLQKDPNQILRPREVR